jgi:hypothetical protein
MTEAELRARIEAEIDRIEAYDPTSGRSPGPLWTMAMVSAREQVLTMLRGFLKEATEHEEPAP